MKSKSIEELVKVAAATRDCIIHPPQGQPTLEDSQFQLPKDLRRFYELTGGCTLFATADFGFHLVAPSEFGPANPLRIPLDYYQEHQEEYDASPTASWYLIATGIGPEEAISMDLAPSRLGHCYDSFYQVHATPDSTVVALSFTELFNHMLATRGKDLWWEREDWSYGKALEEDVLL